MNAPRFCKVFFRSNVISKAEAKIDSRKIDIGRSAIGLAVALSRALYRTRWRLQKNINTAVPAMRRAQVLGSGTAVMSRLQLPILPVSPVEGAASSTI